MTVVRDISRFQRYLFNLAHVGGGQTCAQLAPWIDC